MTAYHCIQVFPTNAEAAQWFRDDGYPDRLGHGVLCDLDAEVGTISIQHESAGVAIADACADQVDQVMGDFLHMLYEEGCRFTAVFAGCDARDTHIVSYKGEMAQDFDTWYQDHGAPEGAGSACDRDDESSQEDLADGARRKQHVLNHGMVRWEGCDEWGVAIEYNPEILDYLKGKRMTDEDIDAVVAEITRQSVDSNISGVLGDLWMDDYQWTTGIDFGHEYDGGGHDISFSWGNCYAQLSVLVEWYDSYAEAAGHEERRDDETCFRIGLATLNKFLEDIETW